MIHLFIFLHAIAFVTGPQPFVVSIDHSPPSTEGSACWSLRGALALFAVEPFHRIYFKKSGLYLVGHQVPNIVQVNFKSNTSK